jgi:hypothetical protein
MHDVIDAFKALGLQGMASAWPEVLGTARMKSLDHEAVLHQLIKAETAQREVRSMAYLSYLGVLIECKGSEAYRTNARRVRAEVELGHRAD